MLEGDPAPGGPTTTSPSTTHRTDGGRLAILLGAHTFLLDAPTVPIVEEPTGRTTWGLAALVVRWEAAQAPSGRTNHGLVLHSQPARNVVPKKARCSQLPSRTLPHT